MHLRFPSATRNGTHATRNLLYGTVFPVPTFPRKLTSVNDLSSAELATRLRQRRRTQKSAMNRLAKRRAKPPSSPSTLDKLAAASRPVDEGAALAAERAAWEEGDWGRRSRAHQFGEAYVPHEMPLRLQDAAYRAQRAAEIDEARVRFEMAEARRRLDEGDAFVAGDFDASLGQRPAEEDAVVEDFVEDVVGRERSDFADVLGAQAYGEDTLNRNTSYRAGVREMPEYGIVADVFGGGDGVSPTTVTAPAKPGWAGVFERAPGTGAVAPPNPFAGPIVFPATPVVVCETGGAGAGLGEVMQRVNEGRGLATLALNNRENAPALEKAGRDREAHEALKAADAGYERALEILMPARKMLAEGPESSKVARVREKDRLEKLLSHILDRWEVVKLKLNDYPDLPDAPSDDPTDGRGNSGDVCDPLLERLSSSLSRMDIHLGDTDARSDAGASVVTRDSGPKQTTQLYPGNGEFKAASHLHPNQEQQLPPDGFDTPSLMGTQNCFCGQSAECMTPCEHFMCRDCSRKALSLFGQCPTCDYPCTEVDLKGIV